MDKRTFIAIILSTLILIIWFQIQAIYFPTPTTGTKGTDKSLASNSTKETNLDTDLVYPSKIIPAPIYVQDEYGQTIEQIIPEEEIVINTDIFRAVFSSKNGTIRSLKLVNTKNIDDKDIELFPKGEEDRAFRIVWGDESSFKDTSDVYYQSSQPDAYSVVFTRDFINTRGQKFTVEKLYSFKNEENLFELHIKIINSNNTILDLGDKYAYTLMFGPQLGPLGEVLDTQKSKELSLRKLVGKEGKKIRNINIKNDRSVNKNTLYKWVGISGRYISMLILTGSTNYNTRFSTYSEPGLNSGAQIYLQRPTIKSSAIEDNYRIYLGPTTIRKTLSRYNEAKDNAFNISNAEFDALKSFRLLGFLEFPTYFLLNLFNKLVKNYGLAIILLTIFVRLCTQPLMNKSKVHGERMKLLTPKMQAIREKFAQDPMKMNQEIMDLYKREKVSPFSSLGPLLIQIPIFLTMYRVIYESFDLWQAPFVAWIKDLSVPDQLITFGTFVVPFLGWNGINLFPMIMLLTQFVSSYIMMKQQDLSSMGSQKLMFIMSYVFPFLIFFALYNSPSGLILYWITSNIFTILTTIKWKGSKESAPLPLLKKKQNLLKK